MPIEKAFSYFQSAESQTKSPFRYEILDPNQIVVGYRYWVGSGPRPNHGGASIRGAATADVVGLAGHEAGIVGGQKVNDRGDFV